MKALFICLILIAFSLSAYAADDPYDSQYCKDPAQLQTWESLLKDNPDSDAVAALHALWVGLCVKVESHSLTTNRAQEIFENFKNGMVEMIQRQNAQGNKKPEA